MLGSVKFWKEVVKIREAGWDASKTTKTVPIKDILRKFDDLFMGRWGYRPVSIAKGDDDWSALDLGSRKKIYCAKMKIFSQFVKYAEDDRELCLKMVEYLFANWDVIGDAMDAPFPDYLMLNSEKFVLALKIWTLKGILPKKRVDPTVGPGGRL
jgi:hypothetical protein